MRAPIGGVVQTLNARAGVTLASGQTLAEISGLGTVWLNAALPEAQAGLVKIGQPATANLTAFPGEAFTGRVVAISTQVDNDPDYPIRNYDRILFNPKQAIPVDFEGDNRLFVIPVEDIVAVFRKDG